MRHVKLVFRITAITTLLLVAVNLVLFFFFYLKDNREKTRNDLEIVRMYTAEKLLRAYPGFTERQMRDILQENWTRTFEYAPYIQFRERPYSGRYVNVSEHGFRHSANQASWPPDTSAFNIFVFGGSTTFGYGLPDSQTVASFLQHRLESTDTKVAVYNFAQGAHYSTQERIYFEQLLLHGHVPGLAIFIDGLNDLYYRQDIPSATSDLARCFESGYEKRSTKYLDNIPVNRLASYIAFRLSPARAGYSENKWRVDVDTMTRAACDSVVLSAIERYVRNKKMTEAVAGVYGVRTFFVWQPIPYYKCRDINGLFRGTKNVLIEFGCMPTGYARLHTLHEKAMPGDNFLWCADIQETMEENLYVDGVHYNAVMTDALAHMIADSLLRRGYIRNAGAGKISGPDDTD